MNRFLLTAGLVLATAVIGVGCDKVKTPTPEVASPYGVTPPSAQADQNNQFSAERNAFAQSSRQELDDLRKGIADLRAKSATASGEAQVKMAIEVDRLEGQLSEAQQRLTELSTATADTWSQVKASFTSAMQKLKLNIEQLRNQP
jgi:hypothetical protein